MNDAPPPDTKKDLKPPAPALTVSMLTAAQMLGVSLRYLKIMVARKEIPVTRFGRKVLISRAYIEGMVNPKPPPPKGAA